jgi:hypothetical protein
MTTWLHLPNLNLTHGTTAGLTQPTPHWILELRVFHSHRYLELWTMRKPQYPLTGGTVHHVIGRTLADSWIPWTSRRKLYDRATRLEQYQSSSD